MHNKSILLLDAGGTQTLPVAEFFFKNNYHVTFFLFSKYTYGSGSKYSHKKIFAPDPSDERLYLKFLVRFISNSEIDLIIPLSDKSAEIVSKYQVEINKYSRHVTPSFQSFSMGYNKGLLMKMCKEHNFPHPETYLINELSDIDDVDINSFPLFLKPNITTGGRGMSKINTKQELISKASSIFKKYGRFHLQEFIQLGGNQYKVQLFRSKNGEIIASSVMHKKRFFPLNGGSSCYNVTIKRNDLVDLGSAVLKHLDWIGFADFDLIEDPDTGVAKILEINPRLPACIKSAFKAGVNYAEMYENESYNQGHKKYVCKPGVGLRHLGLDLLWLLSSGSKPLNERKEWFNFFSPKQYYQDFNIRDLKSFAYGLYGNMKKRYF